MGDTQVATTFSNDVRILRVTEGEGDVQSVSDFKVLEL